ncbi:hypothetical protein CKO25_02370 [Thiocapsa imhoffii]|uniref:DUF2059 domain-containing protein n=1 Tax=Thiocapsa imhoffii TaxID=382777 RepID=A0A9X1B7Y9_9GAMM|nr:hypothetical protein [Thiocapsa imhoffii]MBK1643520.1 hypothetical protein [Thiocapsa imhoffii]
MKDRVTLILALSLLLFSSHSLALSTVEIDRFIASYSEISPLIAARMDDEDEDEDDASTDEGAFIKQRLIEAVAGQSELVAIIEAHGFPSVESWADTSSRVIMAMIAVESAAGMESFASEMEILREEAQDDPSALEEIEQFEQAVMAHQASLQVPQADLDAIQPYLPALRDLFDWDDDEEFEDN